MPPTSRTTVAILGAGPAGLSLAAALDPDRFAVTLHEAEPARAGWGAALGLWPSAWRALTELGVWEKVAESAVATGGGGLFRLDGRRLVRLPRGGPVMLPRATLIAALEASVPPGVRRVHGRVETPEDLDADWVVGADGVRSVVRGVVHPAAAARRATPHVAIRAIAPGSARPDEVGEYWGRGAMFGLVGLGEQHYWFTAHRSSLGPEPLSSAAALREASRVFAGAAPVVSRSLDAAAAVGATRIWVAPPMPRYVRGRFVVIGDAAHASAPNLGRGACDAIVDGVTLGRALQAADAGESGDAAVRRWQASRLPTTQAARVGAGALLRIATRGGPDLT